jgi:REP element-mobilizing transposase RayT
LDGAGTGPTWLKKDNVAHIVRDTLHFYDDKRYDLYAYCIMANHVHLVFKHIDNLKDAKYPITDIMHSIKSYTALQCNRILNREGAFWQIESYDRVIRNQDELETKIRNTLNNPVKAELTKHWKDWPFSYCKPEFAAHFM